MSGPYNAMAVLPRALLLLLGLTVATVGWQRSAHDVAWPDECIYLVGARNVAERGSLDTNYYLAGSLVLRGHPHRDVHMPGYVLALAPLVKAFGATLAVAVGLNVLLFLACILIVHELALLLLEERRQAVFAATAFAVLPPFPGYLFVAYPELLVAFAFLLPLYLSVRCRGARAALLAGVVFGLGAVVRESLLVAFPLHLAKLTRRELLRGFIPGCVLALVLVAAPLSRDRAVHPNALYPSVLWEAQRSPHPFAALASALARNVAQNVEAAARARPASSAEDAVLLLMLGLAVAAAAALPSLRHDARRLCLATLLSGLVLSALVLTLYVVRERGGVWGGVRAYMCLAPPLLICATPLLFRVRPALARGLTLSALLAALLALDARQLYAFLRYKGADHEDQSRYAAYVASHVGRTAPRRIVGRLFLYGFEHYPTEIVWSPPRDFRELTALEKAVGYEYIVINDRSPLRLFLIRNPRYVRVNRDDRDAELLIFRRLE